MISARTKAALTAAKRRDVKLGGDRGARLSESGRKSRRTGASAQSRAWILLLPFKSYRRPAVGFRRLTFRGFVYANEAT